MIGSAVIRNAKAAAASGNKGNPYYTPPASGLDPLRNAINNGEAMSPELFGRYMPGYQSAMGVNSKTGKTELMDPYRMDPKLIGSYTDPKSNAYSESFAKLSGLANSAGPTDMYRKESGIIDANAKRTLGLVAADANRGVAGAMSTLAQNGGLDSGASERAAMQGNLARLNAGQSVYAQANQSKAGALLNDSQRKLGLLQMVGNADLARAGQNVGIQNNAEMYNTGNAIADLRGGNLYAMEGWGKLGDIYGSAAAADAMMRQANAEDPGLLGSGGLLGTGIGGQKGLLGTGLFAGPKGTRDATATGIGFAVGGPVGAGVGYGVSNLGTRTGWY